MMRKMEADSTMTGDFSNNEVRLAIHTLNPAKAANLDHIHPRFLN